MATHTRVDHLTDLPHKGLSMAGDGICIHAICTDAMLMLSANSSSGTIMARDILKTLKAEHDALRELFSELKDTTDRGVKRRAGLLEDIEASLLPHAKWEEKVFYPAFKERADRDGLQTHAEALAEHHAVENSVIPEVHAADPGTPEFAGRTKVFGELIDHHAKEEEKTMFKMARELFSTDERAQLDEEYEAWKQSDAARALVAGEKMKAGAKGAVKAVTG